MKKIIAFLIVITVLLIPISGYAMTSEEFFDHYDNEYKYMIKYSNGHVNYVSSEKPVTFSMSKYYTDGGPILKSGNSVVIYSKGTYYRMRNSGIVDVNTNHKLYVSADPENMIGFEYADVYRRSGNSFFFPNDMKLSPFRQILAGLIPLVGCLLLGISLRKGWVFLKHQLMH